MFMMFDSLLFYFQVIVYDHGQVIEDPSLIGRVGFTGIIRSETSVCHNIIISSVPIFGALYSFSYLRK